MKEVKKIIKPTHWWKPPYSCWNCGQPSGFGFGKEPMRYDIAWCSSECHQKFYKTK